MKRVAIAVIVLASLVSAADKRGRQSAPPDVEIVKVVARRVENRIELDGVAKNVGAKVIEGGILQFDFLSSGNRVISVKKGPFPEELLEPGHECRFSFQMIDEPRSVRFRISAVTERGRDLRIANSGPYPIE